MSRTTTTRTTSTAGTAGAAGASPAVRAGRTARAPRAGKRTSVLAGTALLASALTVTTVPASAHASAPAPAGSGKYVALGDSYAAGAGIPWLSAGLCLRSDRNYGHLVAKALGSSSYADMTCAGAKVSALSKPQTDLGIVVNGPQLDAVTSDTSLVTLTMGGNDLGTSDFGFVDVVVACSALSLTNPFGSPCKDFYGDTLSKRLDTAATKLTEGLRKVSAKAPKAKVVVVGYPAVLPDDPKKCFGKMPATTGDLRFLRSVVGELNDKVAKATTAAGGTFVDTLGPTKGHDGCSSSPWIEGILPGSPAVPLHPNATGERVMADAVLKALG
ncbi:SGNH/GDSL hydrolase family protein, partial [Streptomyces sp. NBRC 110611]|uniref:SGNH/GDSL hydrolase family protein n=1 Tax=Streptomyces sp. NBRC 110611 TaxID=1621259 RepID=UPI00082CF23C